MPPRDPERAKESLRRAEDAVVKARKAWQRHPTWDNQCRMLAATERLRANQRNADELGL